MKTIQCFASIDACLRSLVGCSVLVLAQLTSAQTQTPPGTAPPEVIDAASNGLPTLLSHVPPDAPESYGFAPDSDLAQARLGEPFLLRAITPGTLRSNGLNPSVRSLASETTMWFFPVLLGTEAKALMVVDRQDGRWQAVSLGYAHLARELSLVRSCWPSSKAYHPQVIASFQAKQLYFAVPEVDDVNLTPIEAAANSAFPPGASPSRAGNGGQKYSTLGRASEVVERLRSLAGPASTITGR